MVVGAPSALTKAKVLGVDHYLHLNNNNDNNTE